MSPLVVLPPAAVKATLLPGCSRGLSNRCPDATPKGGVA
jgi:hypothetical protein